MSLTVLGSNGGGGYNLESSLRFRSSASAYLSRTPTTAGNRKTWTWSGWVKRSALSDTNVYQLFSARNANTSPYTLFYFDDDDIRFLDSLGATLVSNSLYRDTSAWYHLICAVDTTQATASNRVKIYVNNEQITSFSTATYPSLNADLTVNSTYPHAVGAQPIPSQYFDGYMTEVNFVDGQALTPLDFGETDTTTGVWKPKRYAGTYGTNGFYLPMNGSKETYTVDYLVIAGGGGGGASAGASAGGAGAGGYRTSYGTSGGGGSAETPAELAQGVTYTVTVGSGGAGASGDATGSSGSNSLISGAALTTITSIGGGGGGKGGTTNSYGLVGGSGGGGGTNSGAGGAGTSGQGYSGGTAETNGNFRAGGGGGASAVGGGSGNLGVGGAGVASTITGSSVTRAGGGGGGAYSGSQASGGAGGGGAGGYSSANNGVAGTTNTGGGGGGSRLGTGGTGGSGVVILRMPTASYSGTTTGSPTVTTDGSDTILTYASSGTYTA